MLVCRSKRCAQARVLGGELLPLAQQVRRHGRIRREAAAENARLKKLLAESMLENEVTREVLRKSGGTGSTRAGALDEPTRAVRVAGAADHWNECELVALSASPGSQR